MKIKNWNKFQHYKNRRPPWIRLHREILEHRAINLLSDCSFRVLVNLWLVASDDEKLEGNLPDLDELSFKLRINKDKLIKCLGELKHFLVQDDSNTLADCLQHAEPEKRREEKRREENRVVKKKVNEKPTEENDLFNSFWEEYPKKKGKKESLKAFKKINPDDGLFFDIITALKKQKETWKDSQYIPHASTWLNGERWNDEVLTGQDKPYNPRG